MVCLTWLLTGVALLLLAAACCCLQWRYAVGEDREALVKATRQDTAEDKAAKEKVHQIKVRCCTAALGALAQQLQHWGF